MTTNENELRDFALESQAAGIPPVAVILELRHLRHAAQDTVRDYAAAIKVQAEKYNINRGALRRYIAAIESDNTEAAAEEARDLERLIDTI